MKHHKYQIVLMISFLLAICLLVVLKKIILTKCGYLPADDLKYTQVYISSYENIKGDVAIADFGKKHIDFDIGANRYGKVVFKQPEKVFRRLKKDYKKVIELISREFHLPPLSIFTYKEYGICGWQVTRVLKKNKNKLIL